MRHNHRYATPSGVEVGVQVGVLLKWAMGIVNVKATVMGTAMDIVTITATAMDIVTITATASVKAVLRYRQSKRW